MRVAAVVYEMNDAHWTSRHLALKDEAVIATTKLPGPAAARALAAGGLLDWPRKPVGARRMKRAGAGCGSRFTGGCRRRTGRTR